jgi:hypothetical protein
MKWNLWPSLYWLFWFVGFVVWETYAGVEKMGAKDVPMLTQAVVVDGRLQSMEAKFVSMPDDLRVICVGDTKGISVGDFVKVEWKSGQLMAGKMKCAQVKWYH